MLESQNGLVECDLGACSYELSKEVDLRPGHEVGWAGAWQPWDYQGMQIAKTAGMWRAAQLTVSSAAHAVPWAVAASALASSSAA